MDIPAVVATVNAGDVIVVKCKDYLNEATREEIKRRFEALIAHGVKVVVLDGTIDVALVAKQA